MLFSLIPMLGLAAVAAAGPASFTDDFSAARPEWRLCPRAEGKVTVADGALRLDLSSPTEKKAAWADLHLALAVPFVLEWDQRLERDSPHTYWAGLCLWRGGEDRARITAGLTGAGGKHQWGLSSAGGSAIRPGVWYHFRLDARDREQTLTVTERDTGAPVGQKAVAIRGLPAGDYFLSFYQNMDRFGDPEGDAYAQDRGVTLVDNLRISATSLRPAVPTGPPVKVPVVFNRKMRWLGPRDGLSSGVIAYDTVGDLWLTGQDAASNWLPDASMKLTAEGNRALLSLPAGAKPAKMVLRCFQYLLDAHPVLEVETLAPNATCKLSVSVTDPYRPYTRRLSTAEISGTTRIPLRDLYRGRGYDHRYAELDFLLEVHPKDAATATEARVSLRLLPQACLVPRSPVVLGAAQSQAEGVPVEAVCVDAGGQLLHADRVRLVARIAGKEVALAEQGRSGVFTGRVKALPKGIHVGTIAARPAPGAPPLPAGLAEAPLRVRVHDGRFVERYSPEAHSYCLSDGKALGPLLGDLYAWNPFVGINTPEERMIRGLEEYRQFVEKPGKSLELTKQRPLTRAQIAAYMEYLAGCGVRAIRLAPNVSTAEEYLDAGGHVAPRGLEQLQVVLEEASRHGIYAVINLFHYPYGSPGTGKNPPVQQFVDAGYTGPKDFTKERTLPLLHAYLAELLGVLREDNAILGYSLTGENDQAYGVPWINALYRFVKDHAPRHLVTQEQGGALQSLPGRDPLAYAEYEPTRSAGLGYRNYYTGGYPSDRYFLVVGRLYERAAPAFLAEVASGPGWYPGAGATWSHPDFITKVRDNFWTSLLLRQPLALSWSACLSEDERRIPTEIARAVDWNTFRRRRPAVAVRAEKPEGEQVARLMQYEAALSALPLEYDILWGDAPAEGYAVVFDARKQFTAPEWGKTLPGALRAAQPLRLSPGSSTTLLDGENGVLIAYVRNTQEYRLGPGYGDGTKELHRQRQKARPVRLEIARRAMPCRYRVWDLDTKAVVREGTLDRDLTLDLGETAHDFGVFLQPLR